MRLILLSPLVLVLVLAAAPCKADSGELERFFTPTDYSIARLSPDGKHFAITAIVDSSAKLVILNSQTRQPVALFTTERNREIEYFWWANSERVVFSQSISQGWLDYPLSTGELFALNIDNSRKFAIAGWAAGDTSGTFDVIHTIPGDRKKIRVVRRPVKNNRIDEARPTAYKLDVYKRPRQQTGTNLQQNALKDRRISPYPWGSFITDNDGDIRLAWYIDREGLLKISILKDKQWQEMPEFTPDAAQLLGDLRAPILGFDSSNNGLYYLAEGNHQTAALFHYDLDTGKRKILFEHPQFDIDRWDMIRASDGEIIGVNLLGTFPEAVFFTEHPETESLKNVHKTFPYQRVTVYNYSDDGQLALLDVRGDQNPGALYLLNRTSNSLAPLFSRRSQIDPKDMSTREPFTIKNDEGMDLFGFVTLPTSVSKPPLLVIPHGGPHGVADTFLFDAEAQFFASQGFAVLQVNFRGSGGYGTPLLAAGAGEWADGMIDDIQLATRWALQQNMADPDRVCIYGGSYGAFAALSSVIQAPELYQCAAGYAGVYDLSIMYESDVPFIPAGKAYLKQVIGTDKARLRSQSPVYHADDIQVPVFIAHGGEDKRAPLAHATALLAAMDKAGVDYEFMIEPDEGHGFFDTSHRLDYYNRLLGFLKKHTAAD